MLKLYYARQSLFARPVWLALVEKQIPFELVPVDIPNHQQLEPEFLALNPFGHIPVLTDDDFRVIESLAILDYLEAKHPTPALLPTAPKMLARVRMVQLVTVNELIPAIAKLLIYSADSPDQAYAQVQAITALRFLETELGDRPYFADNQLSLADIVAGTLVHRLPDLGLPLTDYPNLEQWSARLLARPSWQTIQLEPEEWQRFKRSLRVMPKIWQRRRQQRAVHLLSSPLS
jgi:glutathione S-transferase